LDLKELREILQILQDKDITDFELEEQGVRMRVRRGAAVSEPRPVTSTRASAATPVAVAPEPVPPAASAASADEPGLYIVKSPIVGTFFRSPDPNSPAFVQVGDRVKSGQTLCIIEAMKLMNDIESEVAGEIVRVYPENGQPVQYGEPLFSIRP
jgi:acetyl-CoA carboxylase biotin carboxyl carrier protein